MSDAERVLIHLAGHDDWVREQALRVMGLEPKRTEPEEYGLMRRYDVAQLAFPAVALVLRQITMDEELHWATRKLPIITSSSKYGTNRCGIVFVASKGELVTIGFGLAHRSEFPSPGSAWREIAPWRPGLKNRGTEKRIETWMRTDARDRRRFTPAEVDMLARALCPYLWEQGELFQEEES